MNFANVDFTERERERGERVRGREGFNVSVKLAI